MWSVRVLFWLCIMVQFGLQTDSALHCSNLSHDSNLVSPEIIDRYNLAAVTFALDKAYSNPFDPDVVDASVCFTTLFDGRTRFMPAFWDESSNKWQARLCGDVPGKTVFHIQVRDRDGAYRSAEESFEVRPTSEKGFIRIDPRNHMYLRYDSGKPYHPIGHNACWGDPQNYDRYYGRMAENGENWSRLWIDPYVGQGLEWKSGIEDYGGIGRYSERFSLHFDTILEMARRRGIQVQFVLQSFSSWNTHQFSNWATNPYSRANGGWLESPDQYFTDERAFEFEKKRIRYIIARWSYNPNILAWELFNEVDLTSNFHLQVDAVLEWHRRIAQYIKHIDPYHHLITTSISNDCCPTVRFPQFWELPELDLVQVHRYNKDVPDAQVSLIRDAKRFGKPVILGEFGPSAIPIATRREVSQALRVLEKDPTSRDLHDGIWAAALCESGAMAWWWSEWIDDKDLYPVFRPLAMYMEGEDWADKRLSDTGYNVISDHRVNLVGLVGPRNLYLWANNVSGQFIKGLRVEVTGLENGVFTVEYWDTYRGKNICEELIRVDTKTVILKFPTFTKDIALKMRCSE